VILGSAGSDAVTAAIKTAMLATGRPGLVAFEGGYHGLGHAPLAACGLRDSYRAPFAAQLNPRVTFAPYPRRPADADRALGTVEAALKGGEVGAVLFEPILGRGGCVVPPTGFLRSLHEVAHRHGALIISDEIWTALGRAGSMLRTAAVLAEEGGDDGSIDIVCLGKGLGGGLPVSACVAPEAIMKAWAREAPVVHTSTHAGWPLACATAVATLDTLRFRHLPARALEVGTRALRTFTEAVGGKPGVVEVRGAGLMIAIELDGPERALRATRGMLERGYLLLGGGVRGECLTLTPALTIEEELLGSAAVALAEALAG
jgi:4-aminobutyrate aminotransferase/(S)-3-amino-2-methylpropionate transaminase